MRVFITTFTKSVLHNDFPQQFSRLFGTSVPSNAPVFIPPQRTDNGTASHFCTNQHGRFDRYIVFLLDAPPGIHTRFNGLCNYSYWDLIGLHDITSKMEDRSNVIMDFSYVTTICLQWRGHWQRRARFGHIEFAWKEIVVLYCETNCLDVQRRNSAMWMHRIWSHGIGVERLWLRYDWVCRWRQGRY